MKNLVSADDCGGTRPTAAEYAVPADDKEDARLIIAKIVVDTLKRLRMVYPKPSAGHRRELLEIRKQLLK